jgi:hypothetical protein
MELDGVEKELSTLTFLLDVRPTGTRVPRRRACPAIACGARCSELFAASFYHTEYRRRRRYSRRAAAMEQEKVSTK